MGASSSSIRYRCAGGAGCSSKDSYEKWLGEALFRAINSQDVEKIEEVLGVAPHLKEKELLFPGEQVPNAALGVALNRRDTKVIRALLRAGVSPNLPISEQQRSVYEHRSQIAALNGGDADLQNLVPGTYFEALCTVQHKDLFLLLLENGANPNSGLVQVCHCGDNEMLEAMLARGADPNGWQRKTTPLISSVKSKVQPYDKVLTLLRAGGDPNNVGPLVQVPQGCYPPLVIATRKRDYRMVRILLEAGANVNLLVGDEGLPTPLFWATYWGELELIKLFLTLSKHPLDLTVRKYTSETVFDVAKTSWSFAKTRKPRHIAKLPLPSRPAVVYEKIYEMLEEYRRAHPESDGGPLYSSTRSAGATATTTATWRQGSTQLTSKTEKDTLGSDRVSSIGVDVGVGAHSPPRAVSALGAG